MKKADRIIKLLAIKNPLTARQIAKVLNMNQKTTYYYLKLLKDKGLISSTDGKYYLTDKGKRYAIKLIVKSIIDYIVVIMLATLGISIGLFYNIAIYITNSIIILYLLCRLFEKVVK